MRNRFLSLANKPSILFLNKKNERCIPLSQSHFLITNVNIEDKITSNICF